MPELLPLWRGEFGRWVLLCKGAGRFGWREAGRLRPYSGEDC